MRWLTFIQYAPSLRIFNQSLGKAVFCKGPQLLWKRPQAVQSWHCQFFGFGKRMDKKHLRFGAGEVCFFKQFVQFKLPKPGPSVGGKQLWDPAKLANAMSLARLLGGSIVSPTSQTRLPPETTNMEASITEIIWDFHIWFLSQESPLAVVFFSASLVVCHIFQGGKTM